MRLFKTRGVPIYMLGGNHRWMAYSILRTKYQGNSKKIKKLMLNSVLAVVYWWPDLSDSSVEEMRALAMSHNTEGKCHVPMTFWDEVQLLLHSVLQPC